MITDKRCNFSTGSIAHEPHRWWDGLDTPPGGGYQCDGKVARTTEDVLRVGKQPKIGDAIDGRTGREIVTGVHQHGMVLDVIDSIGREHRRERSPGGYWRIIA